MAIWIYAKLDLQLYGEFLLLICCRLDIVKKLMQLLIVTQDGWGPAFGTCGELAAVFLSGVAECEGRRVAAFFVLVNRF